MIGPTDTSWFRDRRSLLWDCRAMAGTQMSGTTNQELVKRRRAVIAEARKALSAQGRDFDNEAARSGCYHPAELQEKIAASAIRVTSTIKEMLGFIGIDGNAYARGQLSWVANQPAPTQIANAAAPIDVVAAPGAANHGAAFADLAAILASGGANAALAATLLRKLRG